jgi:hypothetical protein
MTDNRWPHLTQEAILAALAEVDGMPEYPALEAIVNARHAEIVAERQRILDQPVTTALGAALHRGGMYSIRRAGEARLDHRMVLTGTEFVQPWGDGPERVAAVFRQFDSTGTYAKRVNVLADRIERAERTEPTATMRASAERQGLVLL